MLQKQDKIPLIESIINIDNKEGLVVPFRFYRMQRYFQLNKGNRNIVLKHRQGGFSSEVLADMFTDCIIIPHTQCAVVSHETHSTQRLLDRVHFYYDKMGNPKPLLGAESRSELSFPELHSSIYIGTAGARAFGHGDTIRKALMSELSLYEDGERILNGVEDAVPYTGEITIECTPQGENNVFYEKWKRAREGKSPYKAFFFPWWWSDDYQLPRGCDFVLPADKEALVYTDEETELIRRANLTENQIRWRRWKIGEKGALFFQEYPEDEVSCFITVGDPVFDSMLLTTMAQNCYDGDRHQEGWIFWRPPQPNMRYIIGADSSAGAPGGSYSAAVVLNDFWEVCATFQARLEPHIFAALLKKMGMWYNNAQIAVERNFTGYAVLGHMREYGNVYHQRDFLSGKVTTNLGWWTNEQTKEYMRTRLRDKLPQLKLWDVNLVRQLRSYRFIRMKPVAQSFDDLAIALQIAVAVRTVEGSSRGYMGHTNWGW